MAKKMEVRKRDTGSPARKALEGGIAIRRKPSLGTGPGVYYIL